MAPKTGEDLSAFDDLFYMPTVPSGNNVEGFWDNGGNSEYKVVTAPISPSQLQVKSFYNKNDIPPAVTMDSTFNDEEEEEEDNRYSFMNTPTSSPHNSAIDYSYSSPDGYYGQEEAPASPWGNIQQSYTAPDTSYSPGREENSPWGDIQQSYTAPDATSENPFDLFETSTTTALKPTSHQYDIVQTQSTLSAGSAIYNNYSLNEQFSKSFIDEDQQELATPAPAIVLSASRKSHYEIEQGNTNKEIVKVAETKNQIAAQPPLVATEVLHPWSSEEVPKTRSNSKNVQAYAQEDMDTYRQGLKGDHGGPIKASLASGYTNANMSTDDIPTKLPVCWHKDLDKMKQQAKIERKRQKLAQKKEKQKPTQKCKGMRAVFGNPKPLQKPETSSISSTDAVKKSKSKSSQVLMNPNTNTKSTAKDPLKMLFSNPKPLQKRPTAASRTLFV